MFSSLLYCLFEAITINSISMDITTKKYERLYLTRVLTNDKNENILGNTDDEIMSTEEDDKEAVLMGLHR